MWHSIRRWRDWAMHELGAGTRSGAGLTALRYGYEKAGLFVRDQPIPWNADVVFVEAELRLPAGGPPRKSDFQLHILGRAPVLPESFQQEHTTETQSLRFHFSPPGQTSVAELGYRNHLLASFTLPALGREEFVNRLQLLMPTLFARLGDESVACRTFVAAQCRELFLSAVVISPTSLVPLIDLGLRVELASEHSSRHSSVAAKLCSSQLEGTQALVTLVPRRFYRRIGTWTAAWHVGEQKLAVQQIRAISQRQFQQSLCVNDARFVYQDENRKVVMSRHLPPPGSVARIGPCFLVSSNEPGMAGVCRLRMAAQTPGGHNSPLLADETVLVTDGPTLFAPGTIDVADLAEVTAFELTSKGNVFASLPLRPAPTAHFNSEGGFKTPSDFAWSMAAEDELNDRLGHLFEGRSRKSGRSDAY
jgi:hypothetical protein